MMPMRANSVGPPDVATRINASVAACHSLASCSAFGSCVMYRPASSSVTSWCPHGNGIGSSKGRRHPVSGIGGRTMPSFSQRRASSKRPINTDGCEHYRGLQCGGNRCSYRRPSTPLALSLEADMNIIENRKEVFLRPLWKSIRGFCQRRPQPECCGQDRKSGG